MHITILGATGGVGRELLVQAVERGHTVVALARNPERVAPAGVNVVAADVFDPESVARAVHRDTTVISGLGVAKGDSGTLLAGATTVIGAEPSRVMWLGAFGTGATAAIAGPFTRGLLKIAMGSELGDKVAADTTILDAGGTVFHAGPLTDRPLAPAYRTVGVESAPRRVFPTTISRATVAAAMLDEAEARRFLGATAIPLAK